ncbi:hypothetical protein LL912_17895 [Niabella sp. CC-SYL272]|uniref:hypothetical protein n=1 Tax=Niabella agricola TaxID=2891571 RepID=UPI001F42644F|nr:hypothetical protein [Niabella agricola]MCF3110661.1 hypothetical protein [Niabella agricola]
MKQFTFFMLLCCLGTGVFASNPVVGERPLQSFHSLFKNVQNVVWASGKDYCDVSFQTEGKLMKARFDNAGNLIQTIRYYKEENLPVFVRQRIHKQYSGCEIYGVTELSTKDALTYTFSLRNNRHLFVVISDLNGDVISSKKYIRSES